MCENCQILKANIKELEVELQREEQAHTMSVYDLNIRIAELEEGIEKHKLYMWGDGIVDHPADEELYGLLKEKGE